MAPIRRVLIWMFIPLLGAAGSYVAAQTKDPHVPFLIEPNRPYVYLKFDHIGPGIPRDKREPETRIWLRIVNNCKLPIVVTENGTPDGSSKAERQIQIQVVPTFEGLVLSGSTSDVGSKPKKEPPAPQLSVQPAEMPSGYMSEGGSLESIPPGKQILFSVPVNFLSNKWHLEIPYTFDLPSGVCCRDPGIGGQPRMVISYSLGDLPPQAIAQIQGK